MSTNVNPFVASAHSIIRRERRLMADAELAELLTELEPRLSPFNRLCAAREALLTGQQILATQEAEEEAIANRLLAQQNGETDPALGELARRLTDMAAGATAAS
jgi:hypothetical protein